MLYMYESWTLVRCKELRTMATTLAAITSVTPWAQCYGQRVGYSQSFTSQSRNFM